MISPSVIPPFIPAPADRSDDSPRQAERLSRSRRNVGEPAQYWPQNSTLKIAMFEFEMSSPYVQAVKKAASEWLPYINLQFEFVSGEEGDVRIALNLQHDISGQSAIGIRARDIPPGHPTMTLPADPASASFESIVIHEFGHMLGAHHAHQHPDANIAWDRASLDRRFSAQTQQLNLLPLERSDTYDLSPYDPDSIMHYSIDPALTTENTFHSRNSILSPGDIAWAQKAYPKPAAAS